MSTSGDETESQKVWAAAIGQRPSMNDITSNLREEFEATFPKPCDVYWNDSDDLEPGYESDCEWSVSIGENYNAKWYGFCAGYLRGLHDS